MIIYLNTDCTEYCFEQKLWVSFWAFEGIQLRS